MISILDTIILWSSTPGEDAREPPFLNGLVHRFRVHGETRRRAPRVQVTETGFGISVNVCVGMVVGRVRMWLFMSGVWRVGMFVEEVGWWVWEMPW